MVTDSSPSMALVCDALPAPLNDDWPEALRALGLIDSGPSGGGGGSRGGYGGGSSSGGFGGGASGGGGRATDMDDEIPF